MGGSKKSAAFGRLCTIRDGCRVEGRCRSGEAVVFANEGGVDRFGVWVGLWRRGFKDSR